VVQRKQGKDTVTSRSKHSSGSDKTSNSLRARQGRTGSLARASVPACLLACVRADNSEDRFMLALEHVCQKETLGGELRAGRKG
jgi:hypothetical protein